MSAPLDKKTIRRVVKEAMRKDRKREKELSPLAKFVNFLYALLDWLEYDNKKKKKK